MGLVFHVRLRIPGGEGCCWHTKVDVPWDRTLRDGDLERMAVQQAVAVFGPQAESWTLIDAGPAR